MKKRFAWVACLALLGSFGHTFVVAEEPTAAPKTISLLSGNELSPNWKLVEEMKDHGTATLKEGTLTLTAGVPMTGVAYIGKTELPVRDYEVSFEARRVEGEDFFAALTFPVRDANTHATLVVGGWGGRCVGISNIQYQSADENSSTSWVDFETGKWYRLRLEVRANRLKAWLDDKELFDVATEGQKLSLRFGDIEFCKPFGLATYSSVGEIRKLQITKLSPEKE